MTFALRDKRSGEIQVLSPMNPLNFVTDERLLEGDLLPDHIERIEVGVELKPKDAIFRKGQ